MLAAEALEVRPRRAAADDARRRVLLAVPRDEPLAQKPEGRSGLQRFEVLGHAVDGDLVALQVLKNASQLEGRERVAGIDDAMGSVERAVARAEGGERSPGGVVGAAHADEDEGIRALAQTGCEGLDLLDLLVRRPVVHVEPAEGAGVAPLACLAAREHVSASGRGPGDLVGGHPGAEVCLVEPKHLGTLAAAGVRGGVVAEVAVLGRVLHAEVRHGAVVGVRQRQDVGVAVGVLTRGVGDGLLEGRAGLEAHGAGDARLLGADDVGGAEVLLGKVAAGHHAEAVERVEGVGKSVLADVLLVGGEVLAVLDHLWRSTRRT